MRLDRLVAFTVAMLLAGCCFPVDERVQGALDTTHLDLGRAQREILPKLSAEDRAFWSVAFAGMIVRARALSSWGRGKSFDVDAAKREEGLVDVPVLTGSGEAR